MQGNSSWYTPPSSALSDEPNSSNYFYSYGHQWNRPPGNYDYRFYSQPMNNMRTCGENFGESNQNTAQGNYESPPMFFRQGAADYEAGSHIRNRSERTRSTATENPHQSNLDKLRSAKLHAKPNDSETENFSSVFTQSLTSLYSQDVDGNFAEEKQFSEDRNTSAVTCTKIKTEETSNDCNQEYSFGPMFEGQSQNSPVLNFQNVKIKTEPYSRDNIPQYENYALDDMYVRRRRGTLAEAYSRKRKHSVPAGAFGSSMGMPANEEKPQRVFQPESQWIPNSIGNCDETSNTTYQRTEFPENFSGFEGSRFTKRTPAKARVTRNRTENAETKPVSTCKKIPKKISPLTVYVKIIDDRILDVTCRRFKKRSKPKTSVEVINEDATGSQGLNMNQAMYANKSWKGIFDVVGNMLQNLVDKVSRTVESSVSNPPDLTDLSPFKAKELLYKFCHDYSLDYKDFTNVEEIIKSNVTSQKEEMPSRKRKGDRMSNTEEPRKRRRGRSSDKEESVEKKPVVIIEKTPIDNKQENVKAKPVEKTKAKMKTARGSRRRDSESESPQPRVLRSLPSRQPRPVPRKTRSSKKFHLKSRYPKRNLRSKKSNVKLGKKLKILIDLSKENDQAEVLEVESDTSSHANSNESGVKKSDVESDSNSKTVKDTIDTKAEEDKHNSDLLQDDESTSFPNRDHVVDHETIDDKPADSADSVIEKVVDGCDDDDEDFGLRQPPQLVRMTDDSSIFQEASEEKDITLSKAEMDRNLSPSYLEDSGLVPGPANAVPPTLQPNENFSRRFSLEQNSSDFVAEKEIQNKLEAMNQDPVLNNGFSPSKKEDSKSENELELPDIKCNITNASDMSQCESNSEDDCIVLEHEAPDRPIKEQTETKSSDSSDTPSLLKEKLLGNSLFEKIGGGSSGDSKRLSLSPCMKNIAKDEQDESILRTLLLDSEAVSNSGVVKEFDSTSVSSPVIANIMGSAGRDALSAMNVNPIKSSDFSGSQPNSSRNGPAVDLAEALRIVKLHYQDSYLNCLSPETYEAAQRHFRDNPTPPISQIVPKCETKETPITDHHQQLTARIKKMREEVVFLHLMAEQKEREKIAIICFKRMKESILRRLCKTYTSGNFRDFVISKVENASESRSGSSSSSSNSYKPPSPNQKNDKCFTISESPKATVSESYRDVPYPAPSPAHCSSINHRSQSIHAPQNTAAHGSSNSTRTNEKVSTVETMVAKATDNYGLDMTNLRERLRSSPEVSTSGTILQKALSSQSSSHTTIPDHPFGPGSWSPRTEHNIKNRSPIGVSKAGPSMHPKIYQDQYNIPLDMMMHSPNVDGRTAKGSDVYSASPETPRPNQKSQMKTMLAEPVPIKAHRNPYRSWSIQAGGRIGEERSCYAKSVPPPNVGPPVSIPSVSTVPNPIESPLQRQLNSNKGLPLHNIGLSAFSAKPGYNVNNHRPGMQSKLESTSGTSDPNRHKKAMDEDCQQVNPGPSVPSIPTSSAMPYGGHIIRNSSTTITTISITNADVLPTTRNPPCNGCGLLTAKFICSGCRKQWYCSSKCQTLRWPEHGNVCEGRRMFSPRPNTYS